MNISPPMTAATPRFRGKLRSLMAAAAKTMSTIVRRFNAL